MLLISHRVNNIANLNKLNKKYGIEIDIRDQGKNLIIVHDPFKKGVKLNSYLKHYRHSFLVANIKSEGIEEKTIKLFKRFKIKNYFLLDSSFPQIIRLIKKKHSKLAIRSSFYENIETAKKLKKKIKWIWYDTFFGLPKGLQEFITLKKYGFKICLVSPELHNLSISNNNKILQKLKKNKLIDAVCTKKKYFSSWS